MQICPHLFIAERPEDREGSDEGFQLLMDACKETGMNKKDLPDFEAALQGWE
jgi:hypothetical protein